MHLTLKALALLLFTSACLAEQNVIRVAAYQYPPFYSLETGENGETLATGFEPDVDVYLASALNARIQYVECIWARCMKMMESGSLDMMGLIQKRPEREKMMLFIDPPYSLDDMTLDVLFYVTKENAERWKSLDDFALKNALIGMVRGVKYFKALDEDESFRRYEVADESHGFDLLIKNRIDVYPNLGAKPEWLPESINEKVTVLPFTHQININLYKAISRESWLMEHQQTISETVRQLRDTRVLQRLAEKHGI